MTPKRSFLMLQGPQSRFFKRLGRVLEDAGHSVAKVNFCGGDVLHWTGSATRIYNGRMGRWAERAVSIMEETGATDLLLFGDRRRMHGDAMAIARARGMRVFVFEEGYLQPDYITFEEHGVNAGSRLPRTAAGVRALAETLPPIPERPVIPNCLRTRVWDTVRHHVGNAVLYGLFPFYRTHRPYPIWWELTGWLPRYRRRVERAARASEAQTAIQAESSPFFLYPLQLNSDFQIRLNSFLTGVPDGIHTVLSSFAASAPKSVRLVIKNHPLDNGLIDYGKEIERWAGLLGVGDRVTYLDGGDGKTLLETCAGVVVVNSSMGLEGLMAGKPVYCLGQALYGFPGLAVTPGEMPLDEYWHRPRTGDPDLLALFLKMLFHCALIRGNYYTDQGIETAINGVMRRLGLK